MSENIFRSKPQKAPVCEGCPARNGTTFAATAMGSSLRSFEGGLNSLRETDRHTELEQNIVAIIDERFIVATIGILNVATDRAAIEKDAQFIEAEYEQRVPSCAGPNTELTLSGFATHCSPANQAFESFLAAQSTE